MVDVIEQHISAFLRALRGELVRSLWRMLRAGVAAFLVVLIAGGIALTAVVYSLGRTPFDALAVLSYIMLAVTALAVAAAASALYLSIAVVRGIERAAHFILDEMRKVEGQLAHSVASGPTLPPLGR